MIKFFRGTWLFIKSIYYRAENAAIADVVNRTHDLYEQAKIKLLFDYIFFYCLSLLPVGLMALITVNEVNLTLIPFMMGMLFICLWLLRKGLSARIVGTLTSMTTLFMPLLSSFFNNQDVSPKYATIWMMSVLLCYITVNLTTSLIWSLVIILYLGAVAYIKLHGIEVYVASGFSRPFQFVSNPIVMSVYLLFMIRSMGMYYKNVMAMERRRTLQQQKQQLSLINQHLTKHFLLVKGFSRSGKNAFNNGELELLEACFTEIEKECAIAIDYLNESKDEEKTKEEPRKPINTLK
ncbi:hypothetical protein CLV59_101957 [Chitinophaga dinghuensis]|uniref:Uncharacterized protein n=1 Tax=Chitinophaga dinghuensis TaxID=1539050 RepID=A0A327WFS3_9BACT|nr:hypothetical protein [Chitinophaga dinghuensis]RAJ88190.1 hypothetical protein CLV59_101957 [Chitinophaga dinghuensis]